MRRKLSLAPAGPPVATLLGSVAPPPLVQPWVLPLSKSFNCAGTGVAAARPAPTDASTPRAMTNPPRQQSLPTRIALLLLPLRTHRFSRRSIPPGSLGNEKMQILQSHSRPPWQCH